MRIALVGDSHSQAVFPILSKLLRERGDDIVLQISKPGWDIVSFKKEGKLESSLIEANPDMVIFSLGGNNQILSERYNDELDWITGIARKANENVNIIYVGPAKSLRIDVERRHQFTNNMIRRYCNEHNIKFIDVYPITMSGHRDDKVHFNSDTYKKWATYVFNQLNSVISEENNTTIVAKKRKTKKKSFKNDIISYSPYIVGGMFVLFLIRKAIERSNNKIKSKQP